MSDELKDQISGGKAIDRAAVLTILQMALGAGEMRFVRQIAEDWLDAYPYDLPVELVRARALVQESKTEMAFKIVKRLCELDPEFAEAQELLAKLARRVKPDVAEQARAAAAALNNPGEVTKDIQAWGQSLVSAQIALAAGKVDKAESEIQATLMKEPPSPLPALLHIKIAQQQGLSWLAVQNLIELYSGQWKHCLQLRLQNAAYLMESGQEKQAVDILHDCVAEDVSGQVARRLWGETHRFSALWPRDLRQVIDIPIPAKVAAGLGWNQIQPNASQAKTVESSTVKVETHVSDIEKEKPAENKAVPAEAVSSLLKPLVIEEAKSIAEPEPVAEIVAEEKAIPEPDFEPVVPITMIPVPKSEDPTEEEIGQALEQIISALPETLIDLEEITSATEESLRLHADGRYPAYILLSTKGGLVKQYGLEGFSNVDAGLRAVAAATDTLPKWGSYVVYADDESSTGAFGLKPVKADDPWAIKHLLKDLDESLRQNGEMIGALLIVGGPSVVPFHHLPNPVDDDDKDVPSDNPYASIDENYFVPTWPAGRLPSGTEKEPTALLKALNRIEASRGVRNAIDTDPLQQLFMRVMMSFGFWKPKRASFGYSAEIWQRASHSVYRAIGEPRKLSICPPTETGKLPKEAAKALQFAYFNLHGVEDGSDWYGQRDPLQTATGPDYPVALSPKDVVNHGNAPQIVFSEACYGANIFNKTVDSALALKFIDSGSKAVVGSTVTSYGSVTTPLIAADLLGQTFWKLLNEGHPAGEALRRAKIAMAQTMHRRQGYLDGEDQKTLISFQLYGDPLAQVAAEDTMPKRIMRVDGGELNTVCDRTETHSGRMEELPQETMATVKAVVKEYLPGMQGSEVSFSHEHTNCQNHNCPLPHAHMKGLMPNRSLVTLSKKVPGAGRMHPQYARITMDAQGKVVKLAVSR